VADAEVSDYRKCVGVQERKLRYQIWLIDGCRWLDARVGLEVKAEQIDCMGSQLAGWIATTDTSTGHGPWPRVGGRGKRRPTV
jgi:hypothetical protein